MGGLASGAWRIAKICFWLILALAVLGKMESSGAFDQPWFWLFLGAGYAIYILGKDIDKLNKRVVELERYKHQQEWNRSDD